jgi:hypothetical protein
MDVQKCRIISADTAYRRKVLLGLLLIFLGCAACLYALHGALHEMERLAGTEPEAALEDIRSLVTAVSVANAFLSAVFCAWFGWLAYRTYTSGQYPPPGTRVLRDTKLRTGRGARMIAVQQVAVALVILSTNGIMWYLHRIVDSLQG